LTQKWITHGSIYYTDRSKLRGGIRVKRLSLTRCVEKLVIGIRPPTYHQVFTLFTLFLSPRPYCKASTLSQWSTLSPRASTYSQTTSPSRPTTKYPCPKPHRMIPTTYPAPLHTIKRTPTQLNSNGQPHQTTRLLARSIFIPWINPPTMLQTTLNPWHGSNHSIRTRPNPYPLRPRMNLSRPAMASCRPRSLPHPHQWTP
jgi:hypothetical protein